MNITTAFRIACAFALLAASAAQAQLILYENDGFGGRSVKAGNSTSNLDDSGFNDRASSMKVLTGQWEVCSDSHFRGQCKTLGPGEYASLRSMGLNDRISSVRALGWTPDGNGGFGGSGDKWGGNDRWGAGSRAVLYAGAGLQGRSFVVRPEGARNLDRTDFNDKARSLRIESGYWIFCSDANYEGNCHTYGPGDYATLASGQNHSISSGRRVSENYPYRGNPNWNNR